MTTREWYCGLIVLVLVAFVAFSCEQWTEMDVISLSQRNAVYVFGIRLFASRSYKEVGATQFQFCDWRQVSGEAPLGWRLFNGCSSLFGEAYETRNSLSEVKIAMSSPQWEALQWENDIGIYDACRKILINHMDKTNGLRVANWKLKEFSEDLVECILAPTSRETKLGTISNLLFIATSTIGHES